MLVLAQLRRCTMVRGWSITFMYWRWRWPRPTNISCPVCANSVHSNKRGASAFGTAPFDGYDLCKPQEREA